MCSEAYLSCLALCSLISRQVHCYSSGYSSPYFPIAMTYLLAYVSGVIHLLAGCPMPSARMYALIEICGRTVAAEQGSVFGQSAYRSALDRRTIAGGDRAPRNNKWFNGCSLEAFGHV